MPSAIGSGLDYLGGAMSNLGLPSVATALGNAGNWFSNPGMPAPLDAATNIPIPNSYGSPSSAITDPTGMGTPASTTPAGEVFSGNPGAGAMSAPASAGSSGLPFESPESVMSGGGMAGPASAPYSPASGAAPANPASTGFFASLLDFLKGGGSSSGSTGTSGTGTGTDWTKQIGPLLGLLGTGTTDILKYIQQRNLMNNLSGQVSALNKPMGANLRRYITAPTVSALQETGNINSPYLTSQAVATAAAPYGFDQNMADLEAVLRQNALAFGMYPDMGDLAGFVTPGIFGGSS